MLLTIRELKASQTFLSQAHILVSAVRALFFGAGETERAAKLNAISVLIDDERECVERLIAKGAGNGNATT